ncbi:MAG TPA: hypothetical protein VFL85_04670 [Candidatus Saccharimonadales bacterium]|nr:hypothetical protein [Candidatus Saccharimonadales bacterium]
MKFQADDDKLTITLEGREVVWALKRKLVIPRAKMTSLTWQPQFLNTRGRLFRVGTGAPGILYAGSFRGTDGWHFLYLRQPKGWPMFNNGRISAPNVLEINTENYPYTRIIVSCREDIGASLTNWWQRIS